MMVMVVKSFVIFCLMNIVTMMILHYLHHNSSIEIFESRRRAQWSARNCLRYWQAAKWALGCWDMRGVLPCVVSVRSNNI